jgi:hypothetical protein
MTGLDPEPPRTGSLQPRPKRAGFGLVVSVVGGLVLLGLCIWGALATWRSAQLANPESHITGHGWAALIIAFVMVSLVGGGLMWLAFYSARRGFDDRVAGKDE